MRKYLMTALALTLLAAGQLAAQAGVITGRVTDAETGAPLPGARVDAAPATGGTATSAISGQEGQFRIADLPAGTYTLIVTLVGYQEQRVTGVRVIAGQTSLQAVSLTPSAFELNPIVVTGSKRPEKIVDAPATVAVVDSRSISERPTVSSLDHIRAAPGADVITYGMRGGNVVLRGFNNIFSGSLHMLADYRIARVPGLHVNLMHFIPTTDEDIERIEVVLGPGSALYGPNTANGVVHLITKSPLDAQGTTVSVSSGARTTGSDEVNDHTIDIFQTSFRTAVRPTENFGIKVSGEFTRGYEWVYVDPAEQSARQDPSALLAAWQLQGVAQTEIQRRLDRIGRRDYDLEDWSFEARADWRPIPDLTTVFAFGRSNAVSAIELTGLGAAQASDWAYSYYQARASYGRFFGQLYVNTSDAGDTYTLKDGESIVDRSKVFAAQLQHGFDLTPRQSFTYGLDYIRTLPESDGTVYGINEDENDISEFGAYLQSETALTPKFDLILAGRIDTHSALQDPVFSPRAGVTFKPTESQSFRLMYNRAFSTPTAINLFLDKSGGLVRGPAGQLGYLSRGQGTTDRGFSFVDGSGNLTGMRSPFSPNPSALLPGTPATLLAFWPAAVQVVAQQAQLPPQLVQLLMQLQPTGGIGMSMLDPLSGNVSRFDAGALLEVPPIEESVTSTFELGYSGLLGDRVLINADTWYSRYKDFVSPLIPVTPLLLMNGEDLGSYLVPELVSRGVSQAQAVAIATGLASVPLAVVSSEDVDADGADIMATYVNFGDVNLWGADLAATILLDDSWSVGMSGSYISKDHLRLPLQDDVEQLVALNAPQLKGSASLGYRNATSGVNGEVRLRYTDGFPANSADYVGTACIGGTGAGVEDCVDAFALVDVNFGYRLPVFQGTTIQLSVSNLFNEPYKSFVGVPEIGRLAMVRLKYSF